MVPRGASVLQAGTPCGPSRRPLNYGPRRYTVGPRPRFGAGPLHYALRATLPGRASNNCARLVRYGLYTPCAKLYLINHEHNVGVGQEIYITSDKKYK